MKDYYDQLHVSVCSGWMVLIKDNEYLRDLCGRYDEGQSLLKK